MSKYYEGLSLAVSGLWRGYGDDEEVENAVEEGDAFVWWARLTRPKVDEVKKARKTRDSADARLNFRELPSPPQNSSKETGRHLTEVSMFRLAHPTRA